MSEEDPRNPDLEHVLELHRRALTAGLRTYLPGVITSYDATLQKASVQVLIQDVLVDESNKRQTKTLAVISDVPVRFLGPARGRITWPVDKGDVCDIFFASSSTARWRAIGGMVDPGDDRHHDLNDAVAVVGLHDFAHVPTDAPQDAIVHHCDMTKLGGSDADQRIVGDSALKTFGAALNAAILAMGVDPAVSALSKLAAALGIDPVTGTGWGAGTTTGKIK